MGCIGACVRRIELFPLFFTPCAVECVKACDAQGCIAPLLLRLQAGTTAKPMRRLPPLLSPVLLSLSALFSQASSMLLSHYVAFGVRAIQPECDGLV